MKMESTAAAPADEIAALEIALARHAKEVRNAQIVDAIRERRINRIHICILMSSVGVLMVMVRIEFAGALIPVLPELIKNGLERLFRWLM